MIALVCLLPSAATSVLVIDRDRNQPGNMLPPSRLGRSWRCSHNGFVLSNDLDGRMRLFPSGSLRPGVSFRGGGESLCLDLSHLTDCLHRLDRQHPPWRGDFQGRPALSCFGNLGFACGAYKMDAKQEAQVAETNATARPGRPA